jgi:hypothetical protein
MVAAKATPDLLHRERPALVDADSDPPTLLHLITFDG